MERQPDPGSNIVLTIDEKIQYIVEKEIDQAMQETQAQAATVIVQNPKHGRDTGAGKSADVQSESFALDHAGGTEEPVGERRLRAGIDVQDRDDFRGAGREADSSG